ncbi:CvfD/Ygs/GSP13 family RNA-binding post-transcriptional regulator [Enterococcus timonensis]|uniref:CvfD/Ygs/GSP13 family RNA-binding post-transcriptional regulator n=1 Tax=Enterococcus timonensis TaxID=1852364 RepID=UPI0008DA61E6|nr:CvfD/Ygs/GSP13 family RNA-binding post-transcriptional regulator [Enterococcus timonensis]
MLKIGQKLAGTITGIQPYGAFVALDDHQQGLIHVSEIQHGFTKEINEYLKIGQKVEVQIIDIDEFSQKISLSMRTLQSQFEPHIYKRKHYFTSKRKKIGFTPIENAMPQWIAETKSFLHEKR